MTLPIATTSAELLKLCTLVNRAQHAAIREGMSPTEVWLGPEHHATLGLMFHPNRPSDEFLEGVLASMGQRPESFISGLKVRLSAEPGVWVGTTYGAKL